MPSCAFHVETTELCFYGCGNVAKFKNKSGNLMCDVSPSKCSAIKKKNSNALKACYENGRDAKETYRNNTQETKDRMNWNKNRRYAEFGYPGKGQFKNALLFERGHCCECCKLSEWMGKPITLELEHSDGDKKNNTRENLKLLCPNCHSQTPTWRRSNKNGWKMKKYTDEEMIVAIETSENINQVLEKLDLRYGSVSTIIKVMVKYKVNFVGS